MRLQRIPKNLQIIKNKLENRRNSAYLRIETNGSLLFYGKLNINLLIQTSLRHCNQYM